MLCWRSMPNEAEVTSDASKLDRRTVAAMDVLAPVRITAAVYLIGGADGASAARRLPPRARR
jgi:hypothetical protein